MSALAIKVTPATKLKNILFATDFSDASMHTLRYRIMAGAHCPVLTYRHREREVTT